jgi:hypothetical protein
MLDYSELTIVKNSDGIPTALGYPINSILLQNNKPLFLGGGGKKKGKRRENKQKKTHTQAHEEDDDEEDEDDENEEVGNFTDFEQLAVPAGLVCMTQTVCRNANAYANENSYGYAYANRMEQEQEPEIVPEGLYEQLLALAETKPPKKQSRHKKQGSKVAKNKTKRNR